MRAINETARSTAKPKFPSRPDTFPGRARHARQPASSARTALSQQHTGTNTCSSGLSWFNAALASLFAVALAASVTQATPLPSFSGIGHLPESPPGSWAYAISADGSTIAGDAVDALGTQAIRRVSGGSVLGLGYLPGGGTQSGAAAVNTDGSVIVGQAAASSAVYEAFRWTASTGMQGLGMPPGASITNAYGVSGDGATVVGWAGFDTYGEAYRWTLSGSWSGLGDLPGGPFSSFAWDISRNGNVIVGAGQTAERLEAFRWTEQTGLIGLGTLGGLDPQTLLGSVATATNLDGSVIVGASTNTSGHREAFRWTPQGMAGLGTLSSLAPWSEARAVSDDGNVVVGWCKDDAGQYRAMIWTPSTGMRNLHDFLANDLGLPVEDWILWHASGISADGTTIVGLGTNPQGQSEGWVAVIPEPASALVLLTLAILMRRKWPE